MNPWMVPQGVSNWSVHLEAFVKYRLGHFSAHSRGVLISPVIVAKQHRLSTGRSWCHIPGLYKLHTLHLHLQKVEILHWQKKSPSDTSNVTAVILICMYIVTREIKGDYSAANTLSNEKLPKLASSWFRKRQTICIETIHNQITKSWCRTHVFQRGIFIPSLKRLLLILSHKEYKRCTGWLISDTEDTQ